MSGKRYEPEVWDEELGRARPAHDVIWEKANGKKIPKGYVVHHIDGNGHNNDPINLQLMTKEEHIGLHSHLRATGQDVVDSTDPDVIKDRAKRRAWFKDYYPKNREKFAEHGKRYKAENREAVAARQKRYYDKNHDKLREQQRVYEENHRAERAARNEAYDAEHHEERLEYFKDYRKANREKCEAKERAYREAHKEEIKAKAAAFREKRRALLAARQRLYIAKKGGKSQEILDELQKVVDRETMLLQERLKQEEKN